MFITTFSLYWFRSFTSYCQPFSKSLKFILCIYIKNISIWITLSKIVWILEHFVWILAIHIVCYSSVFQFVILNTLYIWICFYLLETLLFFFRFVYLKPLFYFPDLPILLDLSCEIIFLPLEVYPSVSEYFRNRVLCFV